MARPALSASNFLPLVTKERLAYATPADRRKIEENISTPIIRVKLFTKNHVEEASSKEEH
jgi:hypothetical protein